jgi:hypothetical protein
MPTEMVNTKTKPVLRYLKFRVLAGETTCLGDLRA